MADGRLADAALDAAEMLSLAGTGQPASLKVKALNRQALVLMRMGKPSAALQVASEAVALAEAGRDEPLLAQSLLRLGEAQFRCLQYDRAVASGQRAARLFESAGDAVGQGHAHWVTAFAHSRHSQDELSRGAAQRAVELARRTGDAQGLGNALNVLSFSCKDIAERIALQEQAALAYERAGAAFGRAMVMGNLSLAFAELGLYRHACRLGEEVMRLCQTMGAGLNRTLQFGGVLGWMIALGDLAAVRERWPEYDALVTEFDEPATRAERTLRASALALAEGNPAAAVKSLRSLLKEARQAKSGHELLALVPLSRALLAAGDAAAALRASQEAAALHRAKDFTRISYGSSQDLWWWHSRALAANGRSDEAWKALQRAHAILLEAVRNVHDAGLRRSTLNKVQVNRDIVCAWLRESALRKLPDAQRLAHLAIPSSLGEPFKRLVDTGLRLNELRSDAELHDFLIDAVTELSGAERVLLVLEAGASVQIAGALLPTGEDARELLRAITPWLDEARRTRAVSLRHGPEPASAVEQRSCLIAPLVAQNRLLGFLYADIEGAFGRLNEADRDLLTMLAAQAAVALDNAQWAQGLERKVDERTAQARGAQAQAEQRANELAIVNSIQQGVSGSLDFQGIVDLVGEKLRSVFGSDNLGIAWRDASNETARLLYAIQHGQRVYPPVMPVNPGSRFMQALFANQPILANSRAEMDALGLKPPPGLLPSLATLTVPIFANDVLLGAITLDSHDGARQFGADDVRLLQTVAGTLGIALENARLFNETKAALEQQTATADVLQVIGSSVADTAPVFDKILHCCEQLFSASMFSLHLVNDAGLLDVARMRFTAATRAMIGEANHRGGRG